MNVFSTAFLLSAQNLHARGPNSSFFSLIHKATWQCATTLLRNLLGVEPMNTYVYIFTLVYGPTDSAAN